MVQAQRGGAVYHEHCGSFVVINSHFLHNSAPGSNHDASGGAIYLLGSDSGVKIIQSTFTNNVANMEGGAVSIRGDYVYLVVRQSTFYNNTAIGGGTNLRGNSAASGGSITACNSQVSVEDVQDLQVRADPLNQVCTHYSGDIDRYDSSILQNYEMIEPIAPPISWQCDSFNIVPSADGDCPVELTGVPCFTLEDYYYNPSVAPNIYIELQDGNHNLDSGFGIEVFNTENFTMVSNGGTLDCSDVSEPASGQAVFDRHFRIQITDVHYVYIGKMTIINCQFVFERVNELVVEGGSFRGTRTTRPALSMATVPKAVVRQLNCSNYIHQMP